MGLAKMQRKRQAVLQVRKESLESAPDVMADPISVSDSACGPKLAIAWIS